MSSRREAFREAQRKRQQQRDALRQAQKLNAQKKREMLQKSQRKFANSEDRKKQASADMDAKRAAVRAKTWRTEEAYITAEYERDKARNAIKEHITLKQTAKKTLETAAAERRTSYSALNPPQRAAENHNASRQYTNRTNVNKL